MCGNAIPIKLFARATWHTSFISIKQQATRLREIVELFIQIDIITHAHRLDVRTLVQAAVIFAFITVKLDQINAYMRDHISNGLLISIHKQGHRSHKRRQGCCNLGCLLYLDITWTGRIKHQADRICSQASRRQSVLNRGDSTDFDSSSHKKLIMKEKHPA